MSAILESLLDDERRAQCCVNDRAMAMSRPIIASQPTIHAVRRASRLHRTINGVIQARPDALRMRTVLLAPCWIGV